MSNIAQRSHGSISQCYLINSLIISQYVYDSFRRVNSWEVTKSKHSLWRGSMLLKSCFICRLKASTINDGNVSLVNSNPVILPAKRCIHWKSITHEKPSRSWFKVWYQDLHDDYMTIKIIILHCPVICDREKESNRKSMEKEYVGYTEMSHLIIESDETLQNSVLSMKSMNFQLCGWVFIRCDKSSSMIQMWFSQVKRALVRPHRLNGGTHLHHQLFLPLHIYHTVNCNLM